MPEYLAPGVYIEEVEIGAKSIEGVSTSTAGFLGKTERGPIAPSFITNFGDFINKYGGFIENYFLAYSVDGFFRNGGKRCFIGRIAGERSLTSKTNLKKQESDKDGNKIDKDLIGIEAVGPGAWGQNVALIIEDAALSKTSNQLFKLTVKYWKEMEPVKGTGPGTQPTDEEKINAQTQKPDVIEIYDNLSPEEKSTDFYEKRINGISNLIIVKKIGDGKPERINKLLESGSDEKIKLLDYEGSIIAGKRTGLSAFEEIDEINIVCIPDESSDPGLTDSIVTHCEKMKDRFAILQADQNVELKSLMPPKDSKYAAFYYPWIYILDPITNVKILVPPGGHIAGIYARSDTERGVHKAPANEVVRGVQELQISLTKEDQANLNPKGVNCIRAFPGRGIRVWGARTTSSDPLWKYLNVRTAIPVLNINTCNRRSKILIVRNHFYLY
jgi:phage tail sheath protein FI